MAAAASAEFVGYLIQRLEEGALKDKGALHRAKVEYCRSRGIEQVPSDAQLLKAAGGFDPALRERLRPVLLTKPMRTLSGVAVVAIMTSPAACPHGRCTFCSGGPAAGSPQAYTGFEPAAMRGARLNFDPSEQVASRLRQLEGLGHATDKVDLILMGGTFTARPLEYQRSFVKGALDGMNGAPSATLDEALVRNEEAPSRCIGMTVETKPDWCRPDDIREMLAYGTTRVELGVQALDDEALAVTNRGHTIADVKAATRAARDAGLKIGYHLMPGLPTMTPLKDVEGFKWLFADPAFRPDMLKVYPTLVLPQTVLFAKWKAGEYTPYDDALSASVIASLKEVLPPWVRIQRVDRDIPSPLIVAGAKKSNLRQLALAELARRGGRCPCIRCREAGHRANKGEEVDLEGELAFRRTDYEAAGGLEAFLEFVDLRGALHAFARLRRSGGEGAAGSRAGEAFLRELKVVGRVAELSPRAEPNDRARLQHRGLGADLVRRCEEIAFVEWSAPVLRVTAGAGVRPYYRALGYRLEPPYMTKERSEPRPA